MAFWTTMPGLGALPVLAGTIVTMGMFDEVSSQYPLPVPVGLPERLHTAVTRELTEKSLQTKDLDCVLSRYVITRDGRLCEVVRPAATWLLPNLPDTEGVDEPDDIYSDLSDVDGTDASVYLRDSEVEHVDTRFHGRLHLHTIFFADDVGLTDLGGVQLRVLGPGFDGEAYSITYTLKFTDGTLVDVEEATASPLRR